MPYKKEWVPADVALVHNDVTIYHAYDEDYYDEPLYYWFTLDAHATTDEAFDVRDLDVPAASARVGTAAEWVMQALREAIEAGLLKTEQ